MLAVQGLEDVSVGFGALGLLWLCLERFDYFWYSTLLIPSGHLGEHRPWYQTVDYKTFAVIFTS